jgi:hypothetical protein
MEMMVWAVALMAVITVLLALATRAVAMRNGRSGLLWFVLGLIFPGVALLVAAVLPSVERGRPAAAV